MFQSVRYKIIVTMFVICLLPSELGAQATIENYNSVTDSRLIDPEDHNWLSYRGTLDGWGFSKLGQINADNVSDLEPVWSFSTGVLGGHESPPIVNDGVMFITTPGNLLYAIEAATGDLLWRYQHNLPENYIAFHRTNRGVALYGDKVYMATLDARVVALDASTGEKVWDTTVQDNSFGYYITMAPLAIDGKILVGTSGGELGIRGFVLSLIHI